MQLGIGLGLNRLGGRAAGFSPADIAGLEGWWDASDTSTITESGGAVSQIDDKSGNGLHMVQAVAANQPSTGSTTVNGLNVLSWDGTDYMLTNSGYASSGGYTAVFVWRHAAGNFALWATDSSTVQFTAASGGPVPTNTSYIPVSLRKNGQAETPVSRGDVFSLFAGQTSIASLRFDFTATHNIGFMSWTTTSSFWPVADFCEAVMYSSQLSTDDLSAVETYLASKWGVTLA